MIAEDDRIDFSEAVKLLEQELGMSTGEAGFTLRELCVSRKVRSERERYAVVGEGLGKAGLLRLSEPTPVEPREWRDRDLDLETEEDGSWYDVKVSRGDVRYWLANQAEEKPENERDAAIMRRLKAGQRRNWKVFSDAVRKDCGKTATERGFSDETIRKVARRMMRSLRLT